MSKKVMEAALWTEEERRFQEEGLASEKALRPELSCLLKAEQGDQNEAQGLRSEGNPLGMSF